MPHGRLNCPSPLPKLAPGAQAAAVAAEFLDAVVAVVHDQQVVLGVEQQAGRAVELARAAALAAPGALHRAVAVVHGDPLQVIIGEVQIVVGVQRQGGRPDHVARLAAVAADLPEEVVLAGDHLDADDVQRLRIAAADHEDAAVAANDHGHRQVKAPPALVRDKTDRVGVLQLKRCGCHTLDAPYTSWNSGVVTTSCSSAAMVRSDCAVDAASAKPTSPQERA